MADTVATMFTSPICSVFRSRIVLGIIAGTALAVSAVAGTVSAHIEISDGDAVAGSSSLLTFQVGHGCDGSPTTEVRIQMPESVNSVTPTRNPFWTVDKVTEALDEPITDSHGNEVTERVTEVVYTATDPLPDGSRDTFVLAVPIPEDAAGETLYFPTIQTCEVGETAWIEIPAEGQDEDDLEAPAPGIVVSEASADAGHDHGDDD